MKNLVHILRARAHWAMAHDDDGLAGVYATPGPRAQGDEATSDPLLAATLLDEVRTPALPAGMLDGFTHATGARGDSPHAVSLHPPQEPALEPHLEPHVDPGEDPGDGGDLN